MKFSWQRALVLLLLGSQLQCFGALHEPMRNYYTLHLQQRQQAALEPLLGLVRVRDLDAESAYDRFQIVVRKSPFELTYASRDVWAVKPNRMLSDLFGRALAQRGLFAGVSRELGERRPAFLVGGELYAIELYDSDDIWFAHLAFSMQMTEVATGKTLWSYQRDLRKQVVVRTFAMVVRALSELASEAFELGIEQLLAEIAPEDMANTAPQLPVVQPDPLLPAPAAPLPTEPIYLPSTEHRLAPAPK